MKIKNIRGWSAMLTVALLTVFIFTACAEKEDPFVPPPPPKEITVDAVGTIYAGQTGHNQITIQWDKPKSADSSWFAGYEVVLTTPGAGGISDTFPIPKNQNWFDATELNVATTYNFRVTALGNSVLEEGKIIRSTQSAPVAWSLATLYTTPLRVYTRNTSGTTGGSGFQISTDPPRDRTVQQVASWEIALGSNDTLIIGSALSVRDSIYKNATGAITHNALITAPLDFDTKVLTDMVRDTDLAHSSLVYSNKIINLQTDPIATAAKDGIVFYAKVNNHYARIIVLKNGNAGNGFLHSSGNTHYVELLVSYQTRQNIPFAKPSL